MCGGIGCFSSLQSCIPAVPAFLFALAQMIFTSFSGTPASAILAHTALRSVCSRLWQYAFSLDASAMVISFVTRSTGLLFAASAISA